MNKLKLGSLFDGSGGFPLAGLMVGITPVWASEVEPFPIRVTTKRIPQMQHLGDISKLNGAEIEPVDIITFGSPCQNLSLAGNREGLDGDKSSLFFQAIRVIKEMRCKTNGKYPRWVLWENVPGSLSSNKGYDFRTIIEEIIKIKAGRSAMRNCSPCNQDETISVPMPKKWTSAGEIMGDDYSIAFRLINAQFFGVPQRRRRMFLVADFGGQSASKILFESEGLFRDFTKKHGSWQRTAANAETGISKPISFEPGAISRLGGHFSVDQTNTLRSHMGDNQMCVAVENHPSDSRIKIDDSGTIQTLTGRIGTGGGNAPMVMSERLESLPISENMGQCLMGSDYKGVQCVFENHSQDTRYKGPLDVAQTVSATYGAGGNNQPFVVGEEPKTMKIRSGCDGGGKGALIQNNMSATLGCNNDQSVFVPKVYGICSDGSNSMKSENPHSGIYEANTARTIDGNGGNPSCNQGGVAIVESYSIQGSMIGRKNENGPQGNGINEGISFTLNTTDKHAVASKGTISSESTYTVRRLTPLECCRLQGFPDYWCDGLETETPSQEDIEFWRNIFETHRMALGKSSKPKSDKQIIKWLKNPYSDSAMYAMWGNGVALPCVVYIMNGIAYWSEKQTNTRV